ncbi:dihydrofolate reductase family protein [Dactylosporangium sp. CS-033363]|uniref:dihydrofolate reductase family protein n=1 Tax=Dactylosporangium sp. CS-033363 TaxID=3239935 RepID=UPI003D91766B
MANLIYLTNCSLDGYMEDEDGEFSWFPPDADVFAFTTEQMRAAGTLMYGRRLYEAMSVWETDPSLAARSAEMAEFARVWRAPEKVVYSTTLTAVSTANTRIEHDLDPATVRKLKETADRDLLIGGATIAARAFEAGLVDECRLLVWPLLVGGGKPALPRGVRTNLDLLEERRFGNGVLFVRYGVG